MKDKITKSEAKKLCNESGFSMERLEHIFDITREPRKYTFNVEHERQNAIKVLNVIANLNQKQRERVLHRALLLNKV
tara:strand:- start:424 stop:654 length:231 start_codon:yes stop_codon:yes gene_type:complete